MRAAQRPGICVGQAFVWASQMPVSSQYDRPFFSLWEPRDLGIDFIVSSQGTRQALCGNACKLRFQVLDLEVTVAGLVGQPMLVVGSSLASPVKHKKYFDGFRQFMLTNIVCYAMTCLSHVQ